MSRLPDSNSVDLRANPALAHLLDELRAQHGASINGIIAYGSCLRSGDIFDGLLDLYLISDDYRSAYSNSALVLANWMLPPNVFYCEVDHEGKTLRAKYALISRADFQKCCSSRRFESYIWGRFAQPVSIIWSRDERSKQILDSCLWGAVCTFLECALPKLPAQGSVDSLWSGGLALSYASELRSERSSRTQELASTSNTWFADVTQAVSRSLGFPLSLYHSDGELHYRAQVPSMQRRLSSTWWVLRRWLGKLMSILRLLKALFTFVGGLDYVAWKLQRHSGQEVVIPDRVRRFPLIFVWGFCWQLYRRGILK
jgi:hypothetical protein